MGRGRSCVLRMAARCATGWSSTFAESVASSFQCDAHATAGQSGGLTEHRQRGQAFRVELASRYHHLVDALALGQLTQPFERTEHPHAVNHSPLLLRIVVDEADCQEPELAILL